MRSFFKIFLASLLALTIFTVIMFVLGIGFFSSVAEEEKPVVKPKTVLVVDISKPLMEQRVEAGIPIPGIQDEEVMGLFDVTRAIDQAASDTAIKGIFMVGTSNPNGFATSAELRQCLLRFKAKNKFIIAFANNYDQRSYELANTAHELYLNTAGMLEWHGYSAQLMFFKNALDKLEVKPEIFYAGQFKSATDPYRYSKMSDPNRLQMRSFLEGLYSLFLTHTADSRKVDTAALRKMATNLSICTAEDALAAGLVDKLMYNDEVKTIIAKKVDAATIEKINFMKLSEYLKVEPKLNTAKDKIALIYAQGEIVDGKGDEQSIGGDTYGHLLRKARFDKNVKAVVLRVNSPGGSAIASEVIWRELILLKKEKPVIVSMSDYAASGGYYIACGADSIFAQPNTLTGSIGVYTMLFDASKGLSNKLGITFDEVTTAPSATLGTPFRPVTNSERVYLQQSVDAIYTRFKTRVAEGRNLKPSYVDSIGQGRIWSGKDAVANGLVDRLGNLDDAIASAAKKAGIKEYKLQEWPEVEPFWQKLFGDKSKPEMQMAFQIKQYMGTEFYTAWQQWQQLKAMAGQAQTRLPFFVMQGGRRP